MRSGTVVATWFRRTGRQILGWALVVAGVILLPAPGPGTLVLVAGVSLLARDYVWAQKILEPLERRATEAARFGVATIPRILLSFLGGAWLFALGVIWFVNPDIPEFSILGVGFGPHLPAGGWGTALGLWSSAIAAWALLGYSVKRWREPPVAAR